MEYRYLAACPGKIRSSNGTLIEGKDLGQKLTKMQLDAAEKKGYIKKVTKQTEK